MTMATRIAVMSEGSILQIGAPADIYETPASRFVADFIGNVNMMEGSLSSDNPDHVIIDCADCKHYVGHGITGVAGMAVSVALRPEKIRLSTEKPANPLGEYNQVLAKVRELSYFGAFTLYHLQLPSGQIIKVSESNLERHRSDPLTWDQEVWASWSPTSQVVLTQ